MTSSCGRLALKGLRSNSSDRTLGIWGHGLLPPARSVFLWGTSLAAPPPPSIPLAAPCLRLGVHLPHSISLLHSSPQVLPSPENPKAPFYSTQCPFLAPLACPLEWNCLGLLGVDHSSHSTLVKVSSGPGWRQEGRSCQQQHSLGRVWGDPCLKAFAFRFLKRVLPRLKRPEVPQRAVCLRPLCVA